VSNPDSQPDDNSPVDQQSSPGQILKAARIKRNQSQKEIADGLFISEQRVEALEQDHYPPFSGRTYVRGYLVNYARLLDLDNQPLLEAFNQIAPHSVVPVDRYRGDDEFQALHSKSSRFKPGLVALTFILLAAIGGYFLNNSALLNKPEPPALISDYQLQVSPAVGPAPDPALSAKKPIKITQSSSPIQINSVVAIALPAAPESESESESEPVKSEIAELTLVFSEQCWTDIRDLSGNKLHYDLQPANSQITLSATLPIKVFLGNTNGTQIFYNGQPYDYPFRGRIADFTLDTPPDKALEP